MLLGQPENGEWNKVTVSLSRSTSVLQTLGQEMHRTHKYHLWVKLARQNCSAESGLLSLLCVYTDWGPSSPTDLEAQGHRNQTEGPGGAHPWATLEGLDLPGHTWGHTAFPPCQPAQSLYPLISSYHWEDYSFLLGCLQV